MTFTLGFSTGDLALVAADTRTYNLERGPDGLPQLGRIIGDGSSKIRQLPGGWLVSNLPPTWKDRLWLDERTTLEPRHALLGTIAVAHQMLAELAPRWPAYADLLRRERMAWAIGLDGDGPALWGFDYDGSDCRRLPDAAQLPQELAEDEYRALALEMFRAIGSPRDRGAVLNAVRAVAALFQEVARRGGPTGSVGETVEIGLLWRPEPGIVVSEHLRADAGAVAQATDAELGALLTPVGTSPAWIDEVTFKKVGSVSAANLIQTASIANEAVTNLKLGAALFVDFNKSTTSTAEVSLTSFSLPANTLGTNGQRLRLTIDGQAVTQECATKFKFGATAVGGNTAIAAGRSFRSVITVTRTGAATEIALELGTIGDGTAANFQGFLFRTAPAETLSDAILIDFRGNVVSGGTLKFDQVMVEYLAI